ncbi:MAG: OmpA family protein [Rhodospirillales bacterium]|nr:OmpA family protein [Alphaproteobacteria bacterium]MCB9986132.1 OmpA family protein [Rhodospirillales bacterium]USO07309.1 MAG: OmpA family protein [Rhodospirillales bacterium]
MSSIRRIGLLAAVLTLSACSMAQGYSENKALNKAQASGSPFTQQLTAEYRAFSNYLLGTMKDYADALHFSRKGLASASGENVMPEPVNDWNLQASQIPALSDARARLVSAYDRGARDIIPGKTAIAQARYDCWIEQDEASVNDTGKHGNLNCKDEFMAAMQEVEAALPAAAPAPADTGVPAPVGMMDGTGEPMALKDAMYLVFFDWDSSAIGQGGASVLDAVVKEINNRGVQQVHVVGNTDTSGSNAYNDALAMRRANAVKKYLIAHGVSANMISVASRGEHDLLVQTADGVREPANRRAVITFQ